MLPFGLGVDALKGRSDSGLNLGELINVSLASILVELASGLDLLGDVLLELSLLLLEADQSSLEIVCDRRECGQYFRLGAGPGEGLALTLFEYLLLELILDERVRQVGILLGEHLDARVLERVDTRLQLSEVLNTDFALCKQEA